MSVYSRPYGAREGSEFQHYEGFSIEYRDASHRYWLHQNGERTPIVSVTTALRVIDKPQLLRWAEDCGAAGAAQVIGEWISLDEALDLAPRDLGNLIREKDLGMDAARDTAADRGTSMHRVLQFWAQERAVPNIGDFPPEHHGYVQALASWLLTARPEPTQVERFVASPIHQYAGRVDLRAEVRRYDTLIDLKTSRTGVPYLEAHLQARGYAMASVECGLGAPERIMIVGLSEDGAFIEAECCATEQDWLSVLSMYRRVTRLQQDVRAQAKGREAAE